MRAYLSDVRHFACWFETDLEGRMFEPNHISTPALTRYLTHLELLRLQPASINRAVVALKRFCGWAQQTGLASGDPARNVRFMRLVPTTPQGLNDLEEGALVRSVTRHGSLRDQAIVVVMLHTGLRAGETCQLEGRDLILEAEKGTLRVTGRGQRVRDVALDAAARAAIRRYHPALPGPSARLFPSTRQGAALSPRALGDLIRKYARLAGLEISAHDLRHRFGSVMARQVPLRRLAQIMGHDSLKTTALYTRASASALQAEVEEIA
ncbi:Site-specific recombinase XerD [Deinococcus marmoris]|uniref:Site-specific recombinase XerD n=2 Tax=Deinococcus marmoris TaxID=249408 RepID=A0A1U7P059_9DEIO|nr:Site-specific recombinase XerD [Deinococcus marmoris]